MHRYLPALAGLMAGAILSTSAAAAAIIHPTFQTCDQPVWPEVALNNEYQGTVHLALMIDVDGDVQETRIERSSGYAILDRAAADRMRSCKFTPGRIDGRAAPQLLKMAYDWTLRDHRPEDVSAARAAAERGDAASQYLLGKMYLYGDGIAKNRVEARKWLRLAAEQGNAGAQDELATLLIPANGQAGDADEALQWFRKAAAQGRARSQYFLGTVLLQRGQTEEGLAWLHKSAAQSYPGAQAALARLPAAN